MCWGYQNVGLLISFFLIKKIPKCNSNSCEGGTCVGDTQT
jgi:hypothetical protein